MNVRVAEEIVLTALRNRQLRGTWYLSDLFRDISKSMVAHACRELPPRYFTDDFLDNLIPKVKGLELVTGQPPFLLLEHKR